MRTDRVLKALVLLLALTLSGCAEWRIHDAASARPVALTFCQTDEVLMHRSTLYFGGDRKGVLIDDAVWLDFLEHEVTPRFPDGLTWFPAHGQWRDAGERMLKESSRVMVLLHAPGRQAQQRINAITKKYRSAFDQESVLQERSAVCARFH